MKTIVFDFDETLTRNDTFLPFLFFANKDSRIFRFIKKVIYGCVYLVYRFGRISNQTLKNVAIKLFIYNYTAEQIKDSAGRFWPLIQFHQQVFDCFLEYLSRSDTKVYLVTASLEEYVSVIQDGHPGVIVYASRLEYRENRIVGLRFNNYKEQKLCFFKNKDIDVLYTDSLSDLPLARISKQIVAVNQKGEMEILSGLEEFQRRK